jgi:hypothetical protein
MLGSLLYRSGTTTLSKSTNASTKEDVREISSDDHVLWDLRGITKYRKESTAQNGIVDLCFKIITPYAIKHLVRNYQAMLSLLLLLFILIENAP